MSALNFWRIAQGVTFTPQASAPSSPSNGAVYYNSSTNLFQFYQNGAFVGLLTGALLANGTIPLTANWNAGAFSATFNSVVVGSSANAITAVNTIASGTSLTFETNGSTIAGSINTSQAWTIGASGAGQHQIINGTGITATNFTGGSYSNFLIARDVSTGTLQLSGGTTANLGAAIALYGDGYPSEDSLIQFSQSGVTVGGVSPSGAWTIGAISGTQTHVVYGSLSISNNLLFSTSGDGITGTTTNDSANTGIVGEIVSASVTSNTNTGATGAGFTATSLSLTAGDWDVSGLLQINSAGATFTSTDFYVGITTTAGGGAGLTSVNSSEITGTLPLTFGKVPLIPPVVRMSLASTTTVYLNGYVSVYTAGQPVYICSMRARRIR